MSTSSGHLGERRRGGQQGGELVDRPSRRGRMANELLGQHIEGVAHVAGLDEPVVHASDHHGGLDQVVAVSREHLAPAGLADLVAGPADALQALAHCAGRLDLHDEVDRAHVDAELERAGGDEAFEVAGFEAVLDLEAALPGSATRGERGRASWPCWPASSFVGTLRHPVSGGAALLCCAASPIRLGGVSERLLAARFSPSTASLVEAGGEALGQTPAVHEHDGRAVLLDQLEQPGVRGRPDRRRTGPAATGPLDGLLGSPHPGHPCPRPGRMTSTSSFLRTPASTSSPVGVALADRATARPVPQEAGDLVEGRRVADRPMRWNGRSALASSRSRERARWGAPLRGGGSRR